MVPIVHQRWRDLLFLHWPVAVEAVRPLVPSALDIDRFDDVAYVSLIPFAIAESRLRGVPRALASRFLEINLRTYVRARDGDVGIYFFSLDASSWLAVAGARLLYGLPYFPAAMTRRTDGAHTVYASRRRGARDARLEVTWRLGDAMEPSRPGTLDWFLVERYLLYVARRGHLYRTRVRHRPYPLRHVTVDGIAETLRRAAGLPAPTVPALVQYSPGVDVDIGWLERVGASRTA
jgi:uncharacterized protein YqjF (DUF2071 family)